MTPGRPFAAVDAMIEMMERALREPKPDRGGKTIDDHRMEAARRRRQAGTDTTGDSK